MNYETEPLNQKLLSIFVKEYSVNCIMKLNLDLRNLYMNYFFITNRFKLIST